MIQHNTLSLRTDEGLKEQEGELKNSQWNIVEIIEVYYKTSNTSLEKFHIRMMMMIKKGT